VEVGEVVVVVAEELRCSCLRTCLTRLPGAPACPMLDGRTRRRRRSGGPRSRLGRWNRWPRLFTHRITPLSWNVCP